MLWYLSLLLGQGVFRGVGRMEKKRLAICVLRESWLQVQGMRVPKIVPRVVVEVRLPSRQDRA